MRAVRGCTWMLLSFGLVSSLGGQGFAQTARKETHKVIVYPSANESIDQLKKHGITKVDNYGSFWVAETDDAQRDALEKSHGDRVARGDYLNRIELSSVALDTTAGEPAIPSHLRHAEVPGKRLRLVQFKGPVLPEWLEQVKATGQVKVVTYIPNNAYLLSLDEKAEANLGALMVPAGPIQWIGSYHPYYKLARFNQQFTGGPVDVLIAVVDGPEADQTIASISGRYGLELPISESHLPNERVVRLMVMPAGLPEIAQRPDVLWIEPAVSAVPHDEKQDFIVGTATNGPGHGPISPLSVAEPLGRYVYFLTNTVGFSTNSFDYPIVDVADTGWDNYVISLYGPFMTNLTGRLPLHPAFREFGVGPFRVAYLYNHFDVPNNCVPNADQCTSCDAYDYYVHGTLVSSVVLGYDDLDDQTFECITRITEQVCLPYQFFCNSDSSPLVTNICIPTMPTNTCFTLMFTNCPGGTFTNAILCASNTFLVTSTYTVPHRDTDGFQFWLGVSPFGRFGVSKIFSDRGRYFLACPRSQATGLFGVPINSLELMVANAYLSRARIQNDSWGEALVPGPGGNAGAYGASSLSYDVLVRDAVSTGLTNPPTPGPSPFNQEFTVIFAGGNDNGTIPSSFGDVLVTPPASAKNVISVGASENVRPLNGCLPFAADSDNSLDLSYFSSFGPTADGRFKPEIVAPGSSIHGALSRVFAFTVPCANPLDPFNTNFVVAAPIDLDDCQSGTSFSAPAVSGAAQLFWWYYMNRLGSTNQPSPAMVKAYMCNSARYLTGLGANDDLPSNAQGMGELDLLRMFDGVPRVLRDEQPFFSYLEIPPGPTNYTPQLFSRTGQSYELSGQVADATKPFRVTLAWTDAPGDPARFKQLSNDLDLKVDIGGQTYKGNVFIGPNSVPGGSFDSINNMESVFLPAGQTGTWSVIVRAVNIAADGVPHKGSDTDQDLALVVYNGMNPSDAPNPATNDSCETAIDITHFPYTTTLSLNPAVFHNTHISPSVARGGINAFWRIPRPTQGTGFAVDTSGSDFPTLLSIWIVESGAGFGVRRAECGALAELFSQSPGTGLVSQATFTANGTNAYYIVAEGVNGATGTLKLNVAAILPPITLTPAGLDFGTLFVGQTSAAPQSVTLQNGSPELINVSSVQIGGANAGDFFFFADLCTGNTLATGGNCQIYVQFIPTGVGLRTATLQVFDNATGSPQTIPLSGIGVTPAAVVCANAASLTFPNTAIGYTSAVQTAAIDNCGFASLFITNAILSGGAAGDYQITSDACSGHAIAPGDSCDIGIVFAPTATGTRAATLQVNSSGTNSPTKFTLGGTGSLPAPRLCLSSGTSIAFGNQEVGSAGAVRSVTVTNCGTAALSISNVTVTGANAGEFILSGGVACSSSSIPIGGTCSFGVSFAPTNMGAKAASVSITDNASGSPHSITLSGAGTGSQPDLSINKNRNVKKFIGQGVLTPPGSIAQQTFSQRGRRGKKAVFYVAFRNVGSSADSFLVQGSGDSTGAFTVKYFLGPSPRPGESAPITSAVEDGTFAAGRLGPSAFTGDATLMRVEITLDRSAPKGTNSVVIIGTSSVNPAKTDSVRATVIVK